MSEARKRVLVVDDEEGQRGIIAGFLERLGYEARGLPDAESTLRFLESDPADLVLMDVRMPGMGGMEGLRRIRAQTGAPPVVLLTAYAEVRGAVESIRSGAADYLEKPVDLDELAVLVAEMVGGGADSSVEALPEVAEDFVVAGEATRRVLREAHLVAATEAAVLITGERGTGKDRIAERIHAWSPKHEGPLVRVTCSDTHCEDLGGGLLGEEAGPTLGQRFGRLDSARNGVLLLDDAGGLEPRCQEQLLSYLDRGERAASEPGGSGPPRARCISTSSRDLEGEVAAGRFREDLFWRLNEFRIHLPPLRERRDEIAGLARGFMASLGKPRTRISPAALRFLEAYSWPGNLRELSSVSRRAAILATGDVVLPEHLPEVVRNPAPGVVRDRDAGPGGGSEDGTFVPAAVGPEGGPSREPPTLSVKETERRLIREALEASAGNRTRAAKLLGISRRTLVYRLKEYGGSP